MSDKINKKKEGKRRKGNEESDRKGNKDKVWKALILQS